MRKVNSLLTLAKLLQQLSEVACLVAKEKNLKCFSHVATLGTLPDVESEGVRQVQVLQFDVVSKYYVQEWVYYLFTPNRLGGESAVTMTSG